MRIAFMGTPEFAVPTLDALVAAGHDVVAAYSQPPRPAGRGKALRPSPVQKRAEALGIEVRTPLSLKDAEAQHAFAALDLDAAVVAAYGLILPILEAPRLGCLNVHASILPRWRGAAPIQRAILAGDSTTGVTIMKMEEGLDTGPMMAVMGTPIGRKTAGELTGELGRLGAEWMVEVLGRWDRIAAQPQAEELATYAPKVRKEETRLDFSRPAIELERMVRAFNPAPGAWFEAGGERIKLLAAEPIEASGQPGEVLPGPELVVACGEQALAALLVQRSGRGPMPAEELLRGFPIPPGTRLG
jgi:methionyl-tRNA formyltransferase